MTDDTGGSDETTAAITRSSSSNSLSSHESSEFNDADETITEGLEAAPSLNSNGNIPARVPASKLLRNKACTRCKSRKIKCGMGATCAACAKAGARCVRPL